MTKLLFLIFLLIVLYNHIIGLVCMQTVLQLNPMGGSQGNFEVHTPYLSKLSGQFIKDVINRGGGGFAKS